MRERTEWLERTNEIKFTKEGRSREKRQSLIKFQFSGITEWWASKPTFLRMESVMNEDKKEAEIEGERERERGCRRRRRLNREKLPRRIEIAGARQSTLWFRSSDRGSRSPIVQRRRHCQKLKKRAVWLNEHRCGEGPRETFHPVKRVSFFEFLLLQSDFSSAKLHTWR